jgi:hypothetical protein
LESIDTRYVASNVECCNVAADAEAISATVDDTTLLTAAAVSEVTFESIIVARAQLAI